MRRRCGRGGARPLRPGDAAAGARRPRASAPAVSSRPLRLAAPQTHRRRRQRHRLHPNEPTPRGRRRGGGGSARRKRSRLLRLLSKREGAQLERRLGTLRRSSLHHCVRPRQQQGLKPGRRRTQSLLRGVCAASLDAQDGELGGWRLHEGLHEAWESTASVGRRPRRAPLRLSLLTMRAARLAAYARARRTASAQSARCAASSPAEPASSPAAPPPLSDSYVPLTATQRLLLSLGAAVGALADPSRADLVAALGCAGRARRPGVAVTPAARAGRPPDTARWCACGRAWLRTPRVLPSWLPARASRTPPSQPAGPCPPVRAAIVRHAAG